MEISIQELKKRIGKQGYYFLKPDEFNKAAISAAEAFWNYPLHMWMSKDGKVDMQLNRKFVLISMKCLHDNALIYSDSSECNDLVICVPPGYRGINAGSFILNGGLGMVSNAGVQIISKLIKFENETLKMQYKYTKNKAWYLFTLSVARKRQHQGIGKKLIHPILEYISQTGEMLYLETCKPENVNIYKHMGFELMEIGKVPCTNLQIFGMLYMSNSEISDLE